MNKVKSSGSGNFKMPASTSGQYGGTKQVGGGGAPSSSGPSGKFVGETSGKFGGTKPVGK